MSRGAPLVMQVSDTHFGTEQAAVLEDLVRLAAEQRPDVVLITGDVTQRARGAQFKAAARFVERLAAEHVLVVPGNHDIPLFDLVARLFTPYAGFRAVFGDVIEPRLTHDALWIVTLRSTRRWRHQDGGLSDAQLRDSAAFLAQAPPGALRVVATHHPVALPPSHPALDSMEAESRHVLQGASAAIRAWQQAGVDVVMGGHIHLPYFLSLAAASPGGKPLWVAQAGTAFSSRLRARTQHTVNLLRRDEHGVWRLERWDHQPARSEFLLADGVPL